MSGRTNYIGVLYMLQSNAEIAQIQKFELKSRIAQIKFCNEESGSAIQRSCRKQFTPQMRKHLLRNCRLIRKSGVYAI